MHIGLLQPRAEVTENSHKSRVIVGPSSKKLFKRKTTKTATTTTSMCMNPSVHMLVGCSVMLEGSRASRVGHRRKNNARGVQRYHFHGTKIEELHFVEQKKRNGKHDEHCPAAKHKHSVGRPRSWISGEKESAQRDKQNKNETQTKRKKHVRCRNVHVNKG